MLASGYRLNKVNLGTDDPEDKPSSKRKAKEAAVSAIATKNDPITLEEESTEDGEGKKVKASTPAKAECLAKPKRKKNRLTLQQSQMTKLLRNQKKQSSNTVLGVAVKAIK